MAPLPDQRLVVVLAIARKVRKQLFVPLPH
jgi:hypothetical protein